MTRKDLDRRTVVCVILHDPKNILKMVFYKQPLSFSWQRIKSAKFGNPKKWFFFVKEDNTLPIFYHTNYIE